MSSFLAKLVVAAAILTGSFWGTGVFLDHLDYPRRTAANQGTIVFVASVDPGDPNWQAATPDTTLAVLEGKITIESRAALGQFEVIFGPFPTKPRARYAISYEVALTKGGLEIGVQSPAQMIRTKPVVAAHDTLTFTAISETTQIDLINSSRLPTAAIVRYLAVTEIE